MVAAAGAAKPVFLGSGISGAKANADASGGSTIAEPITLPEGTTVLLWAACTNNGETDPTVNTDQFENVEYNGEAMTNLVAAQNYNATKPCWTVWGLRKPAGFDTSEHDLTADKGGGGLSAYTNYWAAFGGTIHADICETPVVSTPNATPVDPRTALITTLHPDAIVFCGSVSQGHDTDPMTPTNDLDLFGDVVETTDSTLGAGGSTTADVGSAIGVAEFETPDDYTVGFDAAASDGGQIFALELKPG
jgi:hypothetical protein